MENEEKIIGLLDVVKYTTVKEVTGKRCEEKS